MSEALAQGEMHAPHGSEGGAQAVVDENAKLKEEIEKLKEELKTLRPAGSRDPAVWIASSFEAQAARAVDFGGVVASAAPVESSSIMASAMPHAESQAGLPPSRSSVDDLRDSTQASFEHAKGAIDAAIRAYKIGLQQDTYEKLSDVQKSELKAFGAQVLGAVSATHKSMSEVTDFTNLSVEVKTQFLGILKLTDLMLQDRRGHVAARNLLAILNFLKERDSPASLMNESIHQWEKVREAQESLVRSLDADVAACAALKVSLQTSIERVQKFQLAATCTLCLLGIPIAVLLGLPAIAGCLTGIIAVNTVGAMATLALQKASSYGAEKQQRLEKRKAEAERRKDAALSAKEAVQAFGERVREVLQIEMDVRSACMDADAQNWTDSGLQQMKTDVEEAMMETMKRAKKLWRRFKQECHVEKDIIDLCREANTWSMKDGLIQLFDAEVEKHTRVESQFHLWRLRLSKLEAEIPTLPILLPETPPPSDPPPQEFGVATLATE